MKVIFKTHPDNSVDVSIIRVDSMTELYNWRNMQEAEAFFTGMQVAQRMFNSMIQSLPMNPVKVKI